MVDNAPAPAEPPGALDVNSATSAIDALLAREDTENTQEPDAGKTEASEQTSEASADSQEQETPEQAQEGSEEEATATEEDDSQQEQPQEPAKYTVKIDGQPAEVTLEELQKGYIREQSFTRKSMDLAEKRKAFEAESQAVAKEREQYGKLLTVLQAQIEQADGPEPDWDKLRTEDPFNYVVQRESWREKQDKRAAIRHELARVQAATERDNKAKLESTLEAEGKKLLEAIPQWKDPKKHEADKAEIREFAKSTLGFTDDEIAQTYDSRAVKALWMANQYAKLMASKPKPVDKGPKPLAGGSVQRTPSRVTEATRAKQRLAKTGSQDDAADYFLKSGLV